MASTQFTQAQIQQLWISNGGNPKWARRASAVAMAESGGDSTVINNNPSTKDYSVGLWQVNYYGNLRASRTAQYGSPSFLQTHPDAQAQAAIKISSNGTNFTPWSKFNSGAYLLFIPGGSANAGIVSPAAASASSASAPNLVTVPGFGPLGSQDFSINGQTMALEVFNAISDAILERNIASASTVTLILSDPFRTILRSGIFKQGDALTLAGSPNLSFILVQFTKQGDMLQLVFEAAQVYNLRQQTGATATTTTSDLTSFAQQLIGAIGATLVADTEPLIAPVAIGRGTSSDPNEDSWTCLVRLAATAGWRFFESAGTFYLGTDQFFLGFQSGGTLQEFTETVQNMDFMYDVGLPYGNMTVTAMTNLWAYNPGTPVTVAGMGPGDGVWLVNDMQRDLYNPQATITLMVPMTPAVLLAQATNANDLGIP